MYEPFGIFEGDAGGKGLSTGLAIFEVDGFVSSFVKVLCRSNFLILGDVFAGDVVLAGDDDGGGFLVTVGGGRAKLLAGVICFIGGRIGFGGIFVAGRLI